MLERLGIQEFLVRRWSLVVLAASYSPSRVPSHQVIVERQTHGFVGMLGSSIVAWQGDHVPVNDVIALVNVRRPGMKRCLRPGNLPGFLR
jgi:hypothetical protein